MSHAVDQVSGWGLVCGASTAGDAFSAPFFYVLPKGAFCADGLT